MLLLCLILIGVALAISLPATAAARAAGRRAGAFDSLGVAGQVKAPRRAVPNTGGVAIFAAFALPLAGALAGVWLLGDRVATGPLEALGPHLAGLKEKTPLGLVLLGCAGLLHVMGLIDDRRPLGPFLKLAVMAMPAAAIALVDQTRLLTMLDAYPGGVAASYVITVAWFVVVTNAMNFMDNMDGLAGGVAMIAASCFLAGTLTQSQPQWFVAACLSLLIGAVLGFLWFNFPRAGIFMGDSGSLVIGFLLAFLTVRTTYYTGEGAAAAGGWYALLMPLVILAIPLYDFASVVAIRLAQGRSPFVGDMQHLSHRLEGRGLSRTAAVVVIWGATAVTGLSGVVLGSLKPWQAAVAGGQVVLLLIVFAVFEYAGSSRKAGRA